MFHGAQNRNVLGALASIDSILGGMFPVTIFHFLIAKQFCFSEMISQTNGKRMGTLHCCGLKAPVIRVHAVGFNF